MQFEVMEAKQRAEDAFVSLVDVSGNLRLLQKAPFYFTLCEHIAFFPNVCYSTLFCSYSRVSLLQDFLIDIDHGYGTWLNTTFVA